MKIERRNFLKFFFIGVVAIILGKFLLPKIADWTKGSNKDDKNTKDIKVGNFKVRDNKDELVFMDDQGEEILIIDKQ
ncbi:MAG: hypothetical protein WC242_05290 [Candidatus Paceibacterota bacterium]|jgi:hypothetical protein